MNDWKEYPLQEVASFIDYRGKTPRKTSNGIPLITAKVVKDGFIQKPGEFIAEEDYDAWMTRGFPQYGDVVMTTEAPLGEVAQIQMKCKFALAQRIISMSGKQGVLDNTYFKYALLGPDLQYKIKGRQSGTTVTGIRSAELKKVQIPLPPLSEQQAIARILGSLDDKIELNRQMNHTLETMAQTLFKSWFVDFDPVVARSEGRKPYGMTDEVASLFPSKLVESELGLIPEGWGVHKLEEFIKVIHGFAFKGQYFSDEITDKILLTPGNFYIGGGFNDKKFKYFASDDFPVDYILKHHDLIITMTDLSKEGDTLGYPALVPTIGDKKLLHNQRLGKVEFVSKCFRYFLFYMLCTEDYRNSILGSASGSTVKHTSPNRIRLFKYCHPSFKIIEQFECIVKSKVTQIEANRLQNEKLSSLRIILLPKLISGDIRIKDAEKLVERHI